MAKFISIIYIKNKITNLLHWWSCLDKPILFAILFLQFIGLLIMFSVSPATAARINAPKFHFFIKHVYFTIISIALLVFFSTLREKFIIWLSIFTLPFMIIILLLTLFIGTNIKGATRWITIPFFTTVQPSELLKPIFLVANAFFLNRLNYYTKVKFTTSITIMTLIAILLLWEPDVGTTLVLCVCWTIQIFIANSPLWIIGIIIISGFLSIPILYLTFPHVQLRLKSFFNNCEEKYQVLKATQAIQEGHLFGKGPGEGNVKYQLPDVHTDYIFAAIAEEWGWIACIILISLYLFIILRIFKLSYKIENDVKRNTIISIASLIGIQVFVNIGVNLDILPSKGITLPFISYGGSSLLSMGIMFGIILAITKKKYGLPHDYNLTKELKFRSSPFLSKITKSL